MLRLHLLGAFEAQREDGTPLELPTRKAEQLLAYLWIHRRQPQPRERLAGIFWPESPEPKARLSLRQALSSLRKTLEPTEDLRGKFLRLRRDTVQFLPEAPCWIDVEEFERDLAEAQREDLPAEERLHLLQEAVALYRGDFLEGCYDDWCLAEREYWEGLYLKALGELVATHAERKELEQAIAYAKRSLAKNPLQEGLHRQLMYLYYATGDRDGALRQYRECRNVLERELDVEPAPETKALYREIERRTGAAQLAEVARHAGALIAKYPELGAPFVGRSDECQRLIAAWRRALQGQGSGILVVGEAGAGKTRLGQEIAEYVKKHSNPPGLVFAGRCYEIEGRLPYQPWVEALRGAIADVPPSGLRAVSPLWLGEVVKLVPELAERLPNVRPTPPLHAPEQERNRLFEGLTRFLQKLSQDQPLLLFLDDLQWADDSSLRYMHYLLRRLRGARIVLLGTYRAEEVDEDHPLWALLQYGLKEGVLTSLELAPLSREEVRELIAGTLQTEEIPSGLAEHLYERSQGNPFFAVELLKSLIESGALSPSPGREEQGDRDRDRDGDGDGDRKGKGKGNGNGERRQGIVWQWEPGRPAEREWELPPTVRAVVQTRVLRLSPMSRELLQLISTRTRPVDTRFLAQATRRREEEISPLVDELVRAQFLRPEERAYTVRHDLIREVIYRGLLPERRRQLHLRVGKALEEIRTRRRDENGHELIGEIAEHFYEAGERVQALRYALHAGQRAWESSYAKEEALRFFRRAEELAEQLGDRERLAQAYKGLGEIHCFTDRPEEGMQYCERALTLLEDPEERARVYCAIAHVYHVRRDLEGGLRCCEKALEELGPDAATPAAARAYYHASTFLNWLHRHERAIDYCRRALRLLEDRPDENLEAQILSELGHAYSRRGEPDQAVAYLTRSAELAERSGDPYAVGLAYFKLGLSHYPQDRVEEAIEAWQKSLRAIERLEGRYDERAAVYNHLAYAYLRRGRLEEAIACVLEELRCAEKTQNRGAIARAYGVLGCLYDHSGAASQAEEAFTNALDLAPEHGPMYTAILLTYLHLEDLEGALRWLPRARPHLEERHIQLLASYPSINPTVDRFRESPEFQALREAISGLDSD